MKLAVCQGIGHEKTIYQSVGLFLHDVMVLTKRKGKLRTTPNG